MSRARASLIPCRRRLATRPRAQAFLASLTYPASYAQAAFFGINSFKLTNAKGKSVFARYRYVPRAGEHCLTKDEVKAESPNYLQDAWEARHYVAEGLGRPVGWDDIE